MGARKNWDVCNIAFLLLQILEISLEDYSPSSSQKEEFPIPKAREVAVGLFGSIMTLSLIGPILINSPTTALIDLGIAGFGYSL